MRIYNIGLKDEFISDLVKELNRKLVVVSVVTNSNKQKTVILTEDRDYMRVCSITKKMLVTSNGKSETIVDLLDVKKFNVDLYEYNDGQVYRTKDLVPSFSSI